MFDDVALTAAEYDAYVVACLETGFGAEYPDPAAFVTDDFQRFLDSRARLLATGATHLDRALAAGREVSRAEAARARQLAAFARSRPAALFDRAPGEQGAASADSVAARPDALTEVSEWAVDEAAATLGLSGRAASLLLVEAVTLVEALPATLRALEGGDISLAHARLMIELAGPVADPGRRAQVEATVLPRAGAQTVPALRASLRRAVTRIDAGAAAERLATAIRNRHVRLDPGDDGRSTLVAVMATPVARACRETLGVYAKACEFDEEGVRDLRTHEQRMTDRLADLILRPDADHPAVQVALTLVARVGTLTGHGADADEPGEVEGDLVSATQVRELAYTLGLLPRPEPKEDTAAACNAAAREADDQAAENVSEPAPDDGQLRELLDTRRLAGTALAERPRIAVTDVLTGSLLALTDSTELRTAATTGRGLGPPGGTDAYRPTDPLYRFVRLRDRRCRFPGCRTRARCCDLDHQVPHPHGPTAHDNLACLCEHHHRLSHQAPGWRLRRDPDGGLVWTLPGGRTVTTRPPAFGTDDGSTPPTVATAPSGRERYAAVLTAIENSRPVRASPALPF